MKVEYNLNIYNQSIIAAAIEAYKDYASISVSLIKPGICELNFINCVYDTKETVNEFNNYLIELLNESG
jgi:hypothetical protein